MKRYLIIAVILGSVGFGNLIYNTIATKEAPEPTSSPTLSPVSSYFLDMLLIIERHAETVEAVNNAIVAVNSAAEEPTPDDPSKTQMEAIETPTESVGGIPVSMHQLTIEEILKALGTPPPTPKPVIPSGLQEALTSGVNTLEWALDQVDSEIVDCGKLAPPPEAQNFHDLVVSYLEKERAAWEKLLSYNSSILSEGYGDETELNSANMVSLEARLIWLEARLELEELDPTLESR